MQNENSHDNMTKERILVVDNETQVSKVIAEIIAREDLEVRIADNGYDALEIAKSEPCSVAIVDLKMPGLNGIETIQRLREIDADMEMIVLTGYPSLDSSLAAIEHHVYGYLSKPADRQVILRMVERALERRRLIVENRSLVVQLRLERNHLRDEVVAAKRGLEHGLERSNTFVGESDDIRNVRRFVAQIAPTSLTVLIQGETGTGKGVVARLIHELSGRNPDTFVKINCPAIPETLLESELFGYEPGAFTGAEGKKPGRFKLASGGTVFLDEIGDLPLKLQAKLLQAIEDKCFTPVGGTETITVDFRIIAATNASLEELVAEKKFRADLFYRLNEYSITIPPLRRRTNDIPPLVRHFCDIYGKEFNNPGFEIQDEDMSRLVKRRWRGNVRELGSIIRRFILDTDKPFFLESFRRDPERVPLFLEKASLTNETERDVIRSALKMTNWNRRKAAELVGLTYSSLRRRIAKYNIENC
jgi:DNA-binding NtrC family response regulator